MRAKVYVTLKDGILDPQGVAVAKALDSMGYGAVGNVKVGKFIELDLDGTSAEQAPSVVDDMCRRLLANPIIEQYRYELVND